MPDSSLRVAIKNSLPVWARRVLRAALTYCQRLARWPIILWQVRGANPASRRVLLKSALRAPIECASRLLEWQDPQLLDDCEVTVPGVGRFKLRAHCDDLWHVLPWRERAIFRYLSTTLRPGDTFIDAGANIGVYTVMAARLVGPGGRVIAVEMMPDTSARLEDNIRLNNLTNVTIVKAALGACSGETVVAHVEQGKFGQASIATTDDGGVGTTRVEVNTITLDEIAAGLGKVAAMKMDLEGVELQALQGAACMLSSVNAVVYESWGRARTSELAVDECLRAHGFELRQLNGNNWLAARV